MNVNKKGMRTGNDRSNIIDKLFGTARNEREQVRIDKKISWANHVSNDRETTNTLHEAEHTKAQAIQLIQRLQNR